MKLNELVSTRYHRAFPEALNELAIGYYRTHSLHTRCQFFLDRMVEEQDFELCSDDLSYVNDLPVEEWDELLDAFEYALVADGYIADAHRERFVAQISKRHLYPRSFPQRSIAKYEDILYAAVHLYLAKTPFHYRGKYAQDYMKDEQRLHTVLAPLARRIWDYMKDTPLSRRAFDAFQNSLCKLFLDCLEDAGYAHTYGNAQKMVNMLFKYLACFGDYPTYREHFLWCHMPIDTKILKWAKDTYAIADIQYSISYDKDGRENLLAFYKKKAWTRFDEALYRELTESICRHVTQDPRFAGKTVLAVEFSIWN